MPQNTLINVLRGKTTVQLPYKALMGEYADRLIKYYGGNVTISDPHLDDKLSDDEYAALQAKYPYIGPPVALPPEPPLLDFYKNEDGESVFYRTDLIMDDWVTSPFTEGDGEAEIETPAPKKRGRKPKKNRPCRKLKSKK
jgi:hypothetical protein